MKCSVTLSWKHRKRGCDAVRLERRRHARTAAEEHAVLVLEGLLLLRIEDAPRELAHLRVAEDVRVERELLDGIVDRGVADLPRLRPDDGFGVELHHGTVGVRELALAGVAPLL